MTCRVLFVAVLLAIVSVPTAAAPPDLFSALDRNGDGRLSRRELRTDQAGRASWIAVDRNGDGVVTRDEFTAMSAFERGSADVQPASRASERSGGYSARRLIGAPARDAQGRPAGHVRELMVNALGKVTGLLIEGEDAAEPGERLHRFAWENVHVAPGAAHVVVPTGGASAGATRTIEAPSMRQGEWRATDLLDDVVQLRPGVSYANVVDLILTRRGEVGAVVVDAAADGTPGRHAYPWPSQHGAPSAGRTHVENLTPFDYGALGIAAPSR